MSMLALVLCLAIGVLAVQLAQRRVSARWTKPLQVGLSAACGLALFAVVGFAYVQDYYHAEPEAESAMNGSASVQVTATSNGWLFDGPGTQTALVFYPGAKVEAQAYAPLMSQMADAGVDCFLVDMPLRMAVFGSDAANELLSAYDYDYWIMAGHSMGGMTAATYAAEHADSIDGVVLLAAYATQPLDQGLQVLSVYGDVDGVLERDAYEEGKGLWPADAHEVVIAGGNHAGFGNYGDQQGDGEASITPDEQQEATVEAVVEVVDRLESAA